MTLSEIKQSLIEAKALVADIVDIKNEIKKHKTNVATSAQNVTAQESLTSTKGEVISKLVTSATEANSKIAQLVASFDAYVQKFESTKESVEDEDEGVLAVFEQIKGHKSTSDALLSEITKSREEIDMLKSSAGEDVQHISRIKDEATGYQKEIVDAYGFLTGAGLAHSFRERQTILQGNAKLWRWLLGLSVILWGANIGLIAYFVKMPDVFSWTFFLYKISYSAPGLFAVWYSAVQYSRERRLLESYAFKSATAKALESYTDVLSKRFSDNVYQKNILDFVLYSMETIYRHPSLDGHLPEEEKAESGMLAQFATPIVEMFTKKPAQGAEIKVEPVVKISPIV